MGVYNVMLDLKVAIKNLYTLPLVFGKLPPLFKKNSEINITSYKSIKDATLSATRALIGSTSTESPNFTEYDNEDKVIFFLNGICTDQNVWEINAREIENIFDFKVQPLHNPTHGFLPDLVECVFGRTFDIEDKETYHLYVILKKALRDKDKVIVLAHSQGGIIISQLINHLMNEENPNLYKLEVYTFASAADEMPVGPYYVEHFANKYDYVARIGVIEYRDNFYGRIYERSSSGHLLNIHYLQPLSNGYFCAGRSRLSRYLKYKYRSFIERND